MTNADTHKGRSTTPVLITQQLAGPYGYNTDHNFIHYYFITDDQSAQYWYNADTEGISVVDQPVLVVAVPISAEYRHITRGLLQLQARVAAVAAPDSIILGRLFN
ncbi:Hypothetical protein CINCED_3A018393 [Cinara cedri]|uniref:Uncharacterized protein n=1 Tax=Cinara cedri TaxID=506608 RepID=A0A5E4N853_9HEMI|nr:Hypothetical protein CINCED_3A018393 [Cinara cedri]